MRCASALRAAEDYRQTANRGEIEPLGDAAVAEPADVRGDGWGVQPVLEEARIDDRRSRTNQDHALAETDPDVIGNLGGDSEVGASRDCREGRRGWAPHAQSVFPVGTLGHVGGRLGP